MNNYGDLMCKTDALDIQLHRFRTHQNKARGIHPYIVLIEQGMERFAKGTGMRLPSSPTGTRTTTYQMVDGILA